MHAHGEHHDAAHPAEHGDHAGHPIEHHPDAEQEAPDEGAGSEPHDDQRGVRAVPPGPPGVIPAETPGSVVVGRG